MHITSYDAQTWDLATGNMNRKQRNQFPKKNWMGIVGNTFESWEKTIYLTWHNIFSSSIAMSLHICLIIKWPNIFAKVITKLLMSRKKKLERNKLATFYKLHYFIFFSDVRHTNRFIVESYVELGAHRLRHVDADNAGVDSELRGQPHVFIGRSVHSSALPES